MLRLISAALCLVAISAVLVVPAPAEEPKGKAKGNRLARESSPYLLQHAHNPVNWYAWGPEAF
jgi:hypothetical protein